MVDFPIIAVEIEDNNEYLNTSDVMPGDEAGLEGEQNTADQLPVTNMSNGEITN